MSTTEEVETDSNQVRFETELEFVQCLSNPFFLQSLAQSNLFSDVAFTNYLTYLSYWHQPQYARFIQYPQCLHHLKLLNDASRALIDALERDQNLPMDLAAASLSHWSKWRETRVVGATNWNNGS